MKIYSDIALKHIRAREFLGSSVVNINEDIILDASLKSRLIGVKDDGNIPRDLLKEIFSRTEYLWHTIDSKSSRGRAIDTSLRNPITGRNMTGSSSGSAINVLYGINDIAIGTDGGGSVVYPAMSLNLYYIMAKGMGLRGLSSKKSTDGISFTSGIGLISHSFSEIENLIKDIVPRKGMSEEIKIASNNLEEVSSLELSNKLEMIPSDRVFITDSDNRDVLMKSLRDIFNRYDIIIAYEKDIDLDGMGDSLFGTLGATSRSSQKLSNKRLGKVANMLNLTCIGIPDLRASSGILILAKEGIELGYKAIEIANSLSGEYMPDLYYDYFSRWYLKRKDGITFTI